MSNNDVINVDQDNNIWLDFRSKILDTMIPKLTEKEIENFKYVFYAGRFSTIKSIKQQNFSNDTNYSTIYVKCILPIIQECTNVLEITKTNYLNIH